MTLELKSIKKSLGAFDLPGLDLTVNEGEYLVLVGPSGVGKTVLLEIIAGLMPPDAGRISWRGNDVTRHPPEHRGFGIMYQDYALFPHMTVIENIVYGLRAKNVSKTEARLRAEATARELDILPLLERMPPTLSGGEQQRVALARALVVTPDLLLLDEPLSAVDVRLSRRLRGELKRVQEELGTTFVHVTHDVREALMLGHRVGVMLDGRLRQIDTPAKLFREPSDREVARFLGMQNIFAAQQQEDGFCEADGVRIHVGRRENGYRHVWIRPEEIILSRDSFESSARNQFRCSVVDWDYQDVLVNLRVAVGDMTLNVLLTYASFEKLDVAPGAELHATFKSSSVHCF
ncbi:MAG: ATP-binding cassette domain-containing protein [Candidatus Latescibacterota bacterium]|nr:MAG: ATP-binding cassette domain-containing protein [Candidatus Latescibacterota bacterium]